MMAYHMENMTEEESVESDLDYEIKQARAAVSSRQLAAGSRYANSDPNEDEWEQRAHSERLWKLEELRHQRWLDLWKEREEKDRQAAKQVRAAEVRAAKRAQREAEKAEREQFLANIRQKEALLEEKLRQVEEERQKLESLYLENENRLKGHVASLYQATILPGVAGTSRHDSCSTPTQFMSSRLHSQKDGLVSLKSGQHKWMEGDDCRVWRNAPHKQGDSAVNSGGRCFNCGSTGHLKRDCKNPSIGCYNCRQLGHEASGCMEPHTKEYQEFFKTKNMVGVSGRPSQSGTLGNRKRKAPHEQGDSAVTSGDICFNCGFTGHLKRDCKNPSMGCYNCRQLGHQASECMKPHMKEYQEFLKTINSGRRKMTPAKNLRNPRNQSKKVKRKQEQSCTSKRDGLLAAVTTKRARPAAYGPGSSFARLDSRKKEDSPNQDANGRS